MIWEGAEATDPPDSEIQRAVEQLNGADRSAVTILRAGRALIVGGTAERTDHGAPGFRRGSVLECLLVR